MKIEIEQVKLMRILDYLSVDGLFEFPIITIKDGELLSIQKVKDGFGYRAACFMSEYFKSLSEKQESVKIELAKVKSFATIRKSTDIITLEYPSPVGKNKLRLSSGPAKTNISVMTVEEGEIKTKFPYTVKNKVPYIKKGKVALDTRVVISANSLKEIDAYRSLHKLKTTYYRFVVGEDRKLKVFIGGKQSLDDSTEYTPPGQKVYSDGMAVDVTFVKGIREIAKTFTADISAYLRTNEAAIFYEESQSHKFSMLLAPKTREK